ncbi:helicase HerA domain-containing protein [Teredinibacter turnerae]|uniref:helicase HerA domain-containing protein n=1 Tax=Teredinibacter turnerae TaxID=2426 RepID=UPI0009B7D1EB|nr:DUF87 domain-containing protein [Teredinibacter turnerae]
MHTSVVCMTGAGKGVAMHRLGLVPREHPVIIFDPHGEYKNFAGRQVHRYKTRMNLAKAVGRAWQSRRSFVIAYVPGVEDKSALRREAYWLAELVWAMSDGNRIVAAVFEEFAEYAEGNAQDKSPIGRLWTGGRKFGVWAFAVFQRSAEVPKTIWNNSPRKVIGAQGSPTDKRRVVDELGCSPADVDDLGVRNVALSMYAPEIGEVVRTKTHYLYSQAAGSFERVAAYVKQAEYLRDDYSHDQKSMDNDRLYRMGVV